jgi:uncharacterized protein YlxW (UPF0749 family)
MAQEKKVVVIDKNIKHLHKKQELQDRIREYQVFLDNFQSNGDSAITTEIHKRMNILKSLI